MGNIQILLLVTKASFTWIQGQVQTLMCYSYSTYQKQTTLSLRKIWNVIVASLEHSYFPWRSVLKETKIKWMTMFHFPSRSGNPASIKSFHHFWYSLSSTWGFPFGSAVKNLPAAGAAGERRGFDLRVGRIPWRRAQQPTPVFFPGGFHGHKSLADYWP